MTQFSESAPSETVIPESIRAAALVLDAFLSNLRSTIPPESTAHLQASFDTDHHESIDYDKLAAPFAYRYFLENYWKCVAVFLKEHLRSTQIADLGCGSGAGSVAYLA